ncbi:hypothetical protein SBOR_6292 [Sclerotinia borealis F-4128]|uniref:IBR domain-containing protein n=1 Tax=Sclerotinia borealis (strain F-4128) TaxID=1432307 RepID=W9CBU4_SCLBF|nr:hypothetical protein SBOR_6292 [Sclerotinia borealis F-4128]
MAAISVANMDSILVGNHCFAGIDEESSKLIIQLQLADIERSSSKGKGRADDVSDVSIAFKLQKKELENDALFLSDQQMTRSIALAVQSDGEIVTEAVSRDNVSARDHTMAIQLYQGPGTTNTTPESAVIAQSDIQIIDEEVLEKLQILYVSGRNTKNDDTVELNDRGCGPVAGSLPESSSWASTRPAPPKTATTTTCVVCQDKIKFCNAARVPGSCRYEYCRACLEHLFLLSMSNESLFPPHCCSKPITIASVHLFLTSDIVYAFEQKRIEFETLNRIYCCSKRCSAFIYPSRIINSVTTYGKCGTRTHTLCKMEAHLGDCSNDTVLQGVLDIAREKGWCKCGAAFCYTCGQKWKTCRCERWQEDNLVARATEIANRRPEYQLLDRPYQVIGQSSATDAQIAVAAQTLRENHALQLGSRIKN